MSLTMDFTETLVVTHCWCGIAVGIPENLHAWMKGNSKNHCHCPMGHEFVYSNSFKEKYEEEQRLSRELRRRVTAAHDLLKAEERSHSATKGQLTKVKKRVHHGVCPHCNRSFQDLRRHMRSKHREEMKTE